MKVPANLPPWALPVATGALPALTVLLYVIAFPRFDVAEAAYVFAIPMMAWLLAFQPSFKRVALVAFLSGWVAWSILIAWLRHFTQSAEMFAPALVGWTLMLLLAAILAVFWMGWWLAVAWTIPRILRAPGSTRVMALMGLAAVWVVLEYVRGFLFTGFPWLPLAASQWQRPLVLQISAVTGAWGVSFLLIFFNFALVFYVVRLLQVRRAAWYQRFCPEFYAAIGFLAASIVIGIRAGGDRRGAETLFRVGFVQPNVDPLEKWEPTHSEAVLRDLVELSEFAKLLGAEVILWPEAPVPYPVIGNPHMRRWMEEISARLEVPILSGAIVTLGEQGDRDAPWFNAAVTVSPARGLSGQFYAKRHLVPFGEYVPLSGIFPFLETVVPLPGSFVRGEGAQLITLEVGTQRWRIGTLICFEDIFPRLARESVRAGAELLFVPTNNAWFGEEAGAYQHAAHSVLRAVETRRPVLRSGNAGWSGWIDEFGGIRSMVVGADGHIYFRGAEVGTVRRNPRLAGHLTPFVRFGDWFPLLCLFWAGAAAWLLYRTEEPSESASGLADERPRPPPRRRRLGRLR
jgi:apolipoprotein N-acyltransferase